MLTQNSHIIRFQGEYIGWSKNSNRNRWYVNSRNITAIDIIFCSQIMYDVLFCYMKFVQNIFKSMITAAKQNMLTQNSPIIWFDFYHLSSHTVVTHDVIRYIVFDPKYIRSFTQICMTIQFVYFRYRF